ncbi:Os01g0623750, partial [Oryza sativa Japonica Group]
MMMGLLTSRMSACSKTTPRTYAPERAARPHVLIRSPFSVPTNAAPLTVTFSTPPSSLSFPRLPMLMPWPGPQLTCSTRRLEVPGPTEMQSSPVWMLAPVMVTADDDCTWMPSVLGLLPGATIRASCTATPSHPSITTWYSSLFTDLTPLITTFPAIKLISTLCAVVCTYCCAVRAAAVAGRLARPQRLTAAVEGAAGHGEAVDVVEHNPLPARAGTAGVTGRCDQRAVDLDRHPAAGTRASEGRVADKELAVWHVHGGRLRRPACGGPGGRQCPGRVRPAVRSRVVT